MKIYIASDHGGYDLKQIIKNFLKEEGYDADDLGTNSDDSVDYPDYGKRLCKKVLGSEGLGILICGTGIGMSITANKFKGIYAALCSDEYSARMSREHNNANILCLGGRVIGGELAKEIVKVWLETDFSEDERHKRRVGKIN